jgi:[FeFe] hydrogenase H-cluster maturation GTPase HydF
MSAEAPRGVRLIIALTGRRNVGKSSLINAIAGQEIAIVSAEPGTTTDPVAKPYELLPLGPVTFYDTAGLDDVGPLGELRIKAAKKVLRRADLCVVVAGAEGIGEHEAAVVEEIRALGTPLLVANNMADLGPARAADVEYCRARGIRRLNVSARTGQGVDELKRALIELAPEELKREPPLVSDLVGEGELVLLVVPIDLAAPKGRLILPQVQVLREILDCDALGLIVKERELEHALSGLARKPSLVITDSQVVLKVAGDVPGDVRLTTFSTLFARHKGDLAAFVRGAAAIDRLADGDAVLIAEACSHHPVADDIGRVKIPRWLARYAGKDIRCEVASGHDFPEDLSRFALVVHCGSCMLNRTETLRRIRDCARAGVPITNYGVAIAKVQGVLARIVAPFPGISETPP